MHCSLHTTDKLQLNALNEKMLQCVERLLNGNAIFYMEHPGLSVKTTFLTPISLGAAGAACCWDAG